MTAPVRQRSTTRLGRLYHGETDINFIGRWKVWFAISGVVILIGLIALFTRGLNLGIDFEGGNVWEVRANGVSVADATKAMQSLGLVDPRVQSVGKDLRIQAETFTGTDAQRLAKNDEVVNKLADLTGVKAAQVEVNTVGPSWGKEISSKAERALVIFLIVIFLYITLRFEWKMALATIAALFHDLLVVIGIYAILQLPVTPATVIAILTILGFSIYDGIVVFDRIDENTRLLSGGGGMTYSDMTNLSLNEVLMRSLNTSITAVLPILSVLVLGAWILGATSLEDFGLALFIGLTSGAYSSIFIASPVLALLKETEPRYQALRARVAEKAEKDEVRAQRRQEARVGAGGSGDDDGGSDVSASSAKAVAAKPASTPIPPRPRKKGKKR